MWFYVWLCSAIAIWLVAAAGMLWAAYSMFHVTKELRSNAHWSKWLLGGSILFFSSFFTDEGNRHRRNLGCALLVFILAFVLFAVMIQVGEHLKFTPIR